MSADVFLKPLKTLVSPGVYLYRKYDTFKRRKRERRKAEKRFIEMRDAFDYWLENLEMIPLEEPISEDEECIVCTYAKAAVRTKPCNHKVVCQVCFMKMFQNNLEEATSATCILCRCKLTGVESTYLYMVPPSDPVPPPWVQRRLAKVAAEAGQQSKRGSLAAEKKEDRLSVTTPSSTVTFCSTASSAALPHPTMCSVNSSFSSSSHISTAESSRSSLGTVSSSSCISNDSAVSTTSNVTCISSSSKPKKSLSREELQHQFQQEYRRGKRLSDELHRRKRSRSHTPINGVSKKSGSESIQARLNGSGQRDQAERRRKCHSMYAEIGGLAKDDEVKQRNNDFNISSESKLIIGKSSRSLVLSNQTVGEKSICISNTKREKVLNVEKPKTREAHKGSLYQTLAFNDDDD